MWGRELHPDPREGLPAGTTLGRSAPAPRRGTKAAWGSDGEEMKVILLFPDGGGRVYELNEYEGFRVPNAINIPICGPDGPTGRMLILERSGTFPGGIPVYGGSETVQ